jgi:hypothetical protein
MKKKKMWNGWITTSRSDCGCSETTDWRWMIACGVAFAFFPILYFISKMLFAAYLFPGSMLVLFTFIASDEVSRGSNCSGD